MNEMVQHVDMHTSALTRLQVKDPFISMPRAEDKLAPELEEIWQSTLDQYKMGTDACSYSLHSHILVESYESIIDLQRQKIHLSMEVREEVLTEKRKHETNYEQEIQEIVNLKESM